MPVTPGSATLQSYPAAPNCSVLGLQRGHPTAVSSDTDTNRCPEGPHLKSLAQLLHSSDPCGRSWACDSQSFFWHC